MCNFTYAITSRLVGWVGLFPRNGPIISWQQLHYKLGPVLAVQYTTWRPSCEPVHMELVSRIESVGLKKGQKRNRSSHLLFVAFGETINAGTGLGLVQVPLFTTL